MEFPALFLFKEGQIWQYAGQRSEITKDTLLGYLSGDNFKDSSLVYADDMQDWLEKSLGRTSTKGWLKRYMDWFEDQADEASKELFKKLNLHHWSATTKIIITLFLFVGPITFAFIMFVAWLFMSFYNWVAKSLYERKIRQLQEREKVLLKQLEEL